MTVNRSIAKAAHAIQPWMEQGNPNVQDRRQTAMVDMLADLRHWAQARGVDFDAAVISATNHFIEECDGVVTAHHI